MLDILFLTGFSVAFYSLVFLVSVLTVYHFWFNSLRYAKLGNALPGLPPVPILGSAHLILLLNPKGLIKYVFKRYHEFAHFEVGKAWLGPKLYVAIRTPEDLEAVLNKHLEKSVEYDLFKPWLGDGLLINKGAKWQSHRKMMAPTFHSSVLKTFVSVFDRNSSNMIDKLEKIGDKEFDAHDYMSSLTVDILLETAMGVDKENQISNENVSYRYAKAVMDMCSILHQRHYKIWLRPDFIFNWTSLAKKQVEYLNIIHSLTRKVIKIKNNDHLLRHGNEKNNQKTSIYSQLMKKQDQEIENRSRENILNGSIYSYEHTLKDDLDVLEENDVGEKKRLAFLDFMIEAGHSDDLKITPQDIEDEVNTIMFEGHDTTAAAASFVLSLLGIHQNIQDNVQKELTEIFLDSSRSATFKDTLEMKYLERVILETLRLYPPVPVITRKVTQEFQLPSGSILPAKATVVIPIIFIHRHESYWKNPLVFDPDNFLPEKCQNRNYYHFIPFSAGPRSCLGRKYAMLKLKVILANILRKFQVFSDIAEADFEFTGDIILKRADGFRIRLKKRV